MIRDEQQLESALRQLASFRQMLQAMRLHLEETEPSLLPLASESYERRIQSLQEEICDYLLRMRLPAQGETNAEGSEGEDAASARLLSPTAP